MTVTYINGVSIAELIVYIHSLFLAVLQALRHGFGRSAGWYFLIIFCLARIIGPSMQLATIHNPTTTGLYTGSSILQTVGLSPLMLTALGLLSRALDNISKARKTLVNREMVLAVELVITVALILGIIGGVKAGDDFSKTGHYQPGSLSKAGTGLFIASYIVVVILTILMLFSSEHSEVEDKRILLAVAASLPLLLVRLIYFIMTTFTHLKSFNVVDGNVTVLLCVALIEEFAIVDQESAVHQEQLQEPSEKHNGGFVGTLKKIAQYTIIRKLIMWIVSSVRKHRQRSEMGMGQEIEK